MPGNTIKINNSDDLEWYVGDSKIDELIEWLDKNSFKMNKLNNTRCVNAGSNKIKRKKK